MSGRNSHVKYSEKVLAIGENGSSKRRRSVRVFFADPEATDSSSEDDEESPSAYCERRRERVKRYVMEINIQVSSSTVGGRKLRKKRKMAGTGSTQKFRGVRLRQWGRWAAEIRDPNQHGKRVWLGTYDTAEEAALAYDKSAVRLQGINALTNFPIGQVREKPMIIIPPQQPLQEMAKTIMIRSVLPEHETITTKAKESPFRSPTSVLRFGDDISAVDCSSYFGYDANVDMFGLGLDTALSSMDFYHPQKNRWEDEFGELNTDDFSLGSL